MQNSITENLQKIKQKISVAEEKYHRELGTVKLVAVSKGQSISKIYQAVAAGQKVFAENYLQEALQKMAAPQPEKLEWHFIGHIQSNKTKAIAEHFNWVQSVSSVKIGEQLNKHRPAPLEPLNVCIEVNINQEIQKSGVALTDLFFFASEIIKLPRLKLRGLMSIPKLNQTQEDQRKSFRLLKEAYLDLQNKGFILDTLSMGMSEDFEIAISEGSNMVRIGTAIFGARAR